MRLRVASLLAVSASAAAGLLVLVSACPLPPEIINTLDYPFDGGPCGDAQVRRIPGPACSIACTEQNQAAVAICVNGQFSSCVCAPRECDSGCCPSGPYVPIQCEGNAAMPDPSEGLCPTAEGYLLCNGKCYSTFSCDLPDGYSIVEAGKRRDGSADGAKEASGDATKDVVGEKSEEGGDGGAEGGDAAEGG
jgi:hypothetical protein